MEAEGFGELDPVWQGQPIRVYRRDSSRSGTPLLQKALSMDAVGRPSDGLQSELAKLRLFLCNAEDTLAQAQEKVGKTEALEAEVKKLRDCLKTSSAGPTIDQLSILPDDATACSESQESLLQSTASCTCEFHELRKGNSSPGPRNSTSIQARNQELEKENRDLQVRIEMMESQSAENMSLLRKFKEASSSTPKNNENQQDSNRRRDAHVQAGQTCCSHMEIQGDEGREEFQEHIARDPDDQVVDRQSNCPSYTNFEQAQNSTIRHIDHEKELLELEKRVRNYTDSRFRGIEHSAREREESLTVRDRSILKRSQYLVDEGPALPGLKRIHGMPKTRTAQVILVMKGDSYALGACVVAARAKSVGTTADLVCMVTSDVTEGARNCLSQVFDVIYEVPYLQFSCEKLTTRKQQSYYESWIGQSFTKWNALALAAYDKVLLVDADLLPVSSLDELFDLRAPAATFSSPWANTFKEDGYMDPYVGLEHGDEVQGSLIQQAVRESMAHSAGGKGSYVGLGSLVLLEPNLDTFFALRAFVSSRQPFGVPGLHSGFDEQSLVLFFNTHCPHRPWTHIGQVWNSLAWHEHWLRGAEPKAYHYFNGKPWSVSPAKYPDLKIWYSAAAEMLKTNAKLKPLFSMCLGSPSYMADFEELTAKENEKMDGGLLTESPRLPTENCKDTYNKSEFAWRPLETRPSWADIQDEVSGSTHCTAHVDNSNKSFGSRDKNPPTPHSDHDRLSIDHRRRSPPSIRGSQQYPGQNDRWTQDRGSERWTKPQRAGARSSVQSRSTSKPDFHGNHWQRTDLAPRSHNSDRWRDAGPSKRREDNNDYRPRRIHPADRSERW